MKLRSLRTRVSLLSVFCTLAAVSCFGLFSYWHLSRALASSRLETMEKRTERLITFIDTWPNKATSFTLVDKLRQLSMAMAATDTVEVHDLKGKLIYSSPGPAIYKVAWPDHPCVPMCYGIVHRGGHDIRTLNQVVVLDGQPVRLSLTGVTDEHFEVLRQVRDSYLIFCPVLVVVSIAGGLAISHRALEPVSRIASRARLIGIQDLHERLPVPKTGDEIQMLAETWNDLLGRLDAAVSRLTQFTSDISHDLRTTIAVMQNTAEFALRRRRSEAEYREGFTTIAEECYTTSRLLDDLLAAARADIVQQKIEWYPVDLGDVTLDVCEHLFVGAESKYLSLESHVCCDAWISGDLFLIRRLVTILLDNAIKYTPEGGAVQVTVRRADERIELEVADTGIGIPADSLPRIFDRFYRVDNSRSREDGSTGLGLAIAQWIVEAHQSTITVAATPGKGSTFRVSMAAHAFGPLEPESNQRVVTV